ncbi:DUF4157 domain-containing protein [Kitasatospora sp. NPDC056181]|uniref:eCIS core domain-containing protein n=1 Tax=Kitasatospora sp. NPDC056181 TaxID=3345737 RepID=UPI0035D878FA
MHDRSRSHSKPAPAPTPSPPVPGGARAGHDRPDTADLQQPATPSAGQPDLSHVPLRGHAEGEEGETTGEAADRGSGRASATAGEGAERQADAAATVGGAVLSTPAPVEPGEASHVQHLVPRSPGAPLDAGTGQEMSARFGHDFSGVRVHTDAQAAGLAAGQHAKAYTVGNDIVFGAGRYAPQSEAGQGLLAHELGHVVQQSAAGGLAVQCDDLDNPDRTGPAAPADPEAVLGQRLAKDFPAGVALAFYAPMPSPKDREEARNAARKWARREKALALTGKKATASNVVFGEAMSDADHPLTATVRALGALLPAAVAKAPTPEGPVPPGTGPNTVRTLAVFAHGASNWCGLGSISSSTAASVIKQIAPALAPNVTVVLYSCNGGREPDASEDWVKGTMEPGGRHSLAAVVRDSLIAEGKGGSVWGHTTTGHVSENFALREFDTVSGKGSEGASFVTRYVFSPADKLTGAGQLLDGAVAEGYEVGPKGAARADQAVEHEMYACYAEANRELNLGGGKLAEVAPVHPVEVGRLVHDYWLTTYWPRRKDAAVAALVKQLVSSGLAKKTGTR